MFKLAAKATERGLHAHMHLVQFLRRHCMHVEVCPVRRVLQQGFERSLAENHGLM